MKLAPENEDIIEYREGLTTKMFPDYCDILRRLNPSPDARFLIDNIRIDHIRVMNPKTVASTGFISELGQDYVITLEFDRKKWAKTLAKGLRLHISKREISGRRKSFPGPVLFSESQLLLNSVAVQLAASPVTSALTDEVFTPCIVINEPA